MIAPDGQMLTSDGRAAGQTAFVADKSRLWMVDNSLAGAGRDGDLLMLRPLPVKPTACQLAAGARAGGVSVECAWRIYQAMVAGEGG